VHAKAHVINFEVTISSQTFYVTFPVHYKMKLVKIITDDYQSVRLWNKIVDGINDAA
jgi:hypothetical protein